MSIEEYEMTHMEELTRKYKNEAKERHANTETYKQRQKSKEMRRQRPVEKQ